MTATKCPSGSTYFSTMRDHFPFQRTTWEMDLAFTQMSLSSRSSTGLTGTRACVILRDDFCETMPRTMPINHREAWLLSGRLLGIGFRRVRLRHRTTATGTVTRSRRSGTPTRQTSSFKTERMAEYQERSILGGYVREILTTTNGSLECRLLSLRRRGWSTVEQTLFTGTRALSARSLPLGP